MRKRGAGPRRPCVAPPIIGPRCAAPMQRSGGRRAGCRFDRPLRRPSPLACSARSTSRRRHPRRRHRRLGRADRPASPCSRLLHRRAARPPLAPAAGALDHRRGGRIRRLAADLVRAERLHDRSSAAVKVLEYGVLGARRVLFVRGARSLAASSGCRRRSPRSRDLWAIRGFLEHPGARQDSFTGAHDLAALCSMRWSSPSPRSFSARHRLGRLLLVAGIVGVVGVIARRRAREPARALPRRRGRRPARAYAARLTLARARRRSRARRCVTARLALAAPGRARLPQRVVRPTQERARPVRGELEPAARSSRTSTAASSRQPGGRDRLVRRAAAEGVGALPPRREARSSPTSRRTTSRSRRAT